MPDLPLAGPLLDMLSNAVVVKASIERWTVSGRLRIKLRPLLSDVPIIGGVQVGGWHQWGGCGQAVAGWGTVRRASYLSAGQHGEGRIEARQPRPLHLSTLSSAHTHALPVAATPTPTHSPNSATPLHSLQVSLVEVPRFSFDLSIWFGELAVLPGLESWLHALIRDSVFRPFVLPERCVCGGRERGGGGVLAEC